MTTQLCAHGPRSLELSVGSSTKRPGEWRSNEDGCRCLIGWLLPVVYDVVSKNFSALN